VSDSPSKGLVRTGVGAVGIVQAILGFALLFTGAEVTTAVFGVAVPEPFPSLLAAAFLGFAAMNWIARHNILGGIYGRAVVAANQTHFVIGALVLVKPLLTGMITAPRIVMAVFYFVGAGFFIRLLASPGLRSTGTER